LKEARTSREKRRKRKKGRRKKERNKGRKKQRERKKENKVARRPIYIDIKGLYYYSGCKRKAKVVPILSTAPRLEELYLCIK
jgi:hypothetical protein